METSSLLVSFVLSFRITIHVLTYGSVSKQTVKIGTVKIDEIFEKLGEVCHESGQCETNDITIDGQLIQAGRGGDVSDITVTLGPDGEYPTWIRNGLLDSLKAAVLSMAKCEDVTNIDDCSYASAMAYCPRKSLKCGQAAQGLHTDPSPRTHNHCQRMRSAPILGCQFPGPGRGKRCSAQHRRRCDHGLYGEQSLRGHDDCFGRGCR